MIWANPCIGPCSGSSYKKPCMNYSLWQTPRTANNNDEMPTIPYHFLTALAIHQKYYNQSKPYFCGFVQYASKTEKKETDAPHQAPRNKSHGHNCILCIMISKCTCLVVSKVTWWHTEWSRAKQLDSQKHRLKRAGMIGLCGSVDGV